MLKKFISLFLSFTFLFLCLAIIIFRIIPNFTENSKEKEIATLQRKQVEKIQNMDKPSKMIAPQKDSIEESPPKEEIKEVTPPQEEMNIGPPSNQLSQSNVSQGKVICIDPGHQARQNTNLETVAPSSSQTKAKVSSGTQGVASGVPEYQWNLEFSKLLGQVLAEAGYQVVLTRESNEVDLSNQERAFLANESGAQIYLRIHANGSSNSSIEGIETYFVSGNNPDAGKWSQASKRLSELILQEACQSSGAKNRGAMARDDLTGSNFATLPTSLLELGYMSNPQEDQRLNDPDYQMKLAQGILSAVNQYFLEFP